MEDPVLSLSGKEDVISAVALSSGACAMEVADRKDVFHHVWLSFLNRKRDLLKGSCLTRLDHLGLLRALPLTLGAANYLSISFGVLQMLEDEGMGEVVKDLAAGTVGGAAQLVVGHPFDTIKVKLQSQPTPLPGQPPKFSGAFDAVKQTLAAEGAGGLYKGMGAPLATVAAFNAVLFTVRGQMETLLRSQPGAPLTVSQQVICGAGAGVAVSFLACPTELIKCRLQAQSALGDAGSVSGAVKYGGPLDVAKQVLRSEGGARGLFKGLVPTMAREIPGNAAMFGVYEALKQFFAGSQDTSGLGRGSLIVAGGLGGAAFWASVYPTDVVKSVLQVDDFKNPKYSGSVDAFKKILASEGVKGLYKGFGPAMARSIPANAACFLAYEVTRSSLG
ncbi:mitochondrial carnitine/acylcarnitine carrier-like protein [Malus sylvestris]|nr:mitochondrial carnitine/acylcarnitine carrier-like protein [Malus sylvestris]